MSKKLSKAYETLGKDFIAELEALGPEGLKDRISSASQSMQAVADELEANEKYKAAKEAVTDLSAGKREVDKRQKAIILVALSLLNK